MHKHWRENRGNLPTMEHKESLCTHQHGVHVLAEKLKVGARDMDCSGRPDKWELRLRERQQPSLSRFYINNREQEIPEQ